LRRLAKTLIELEYQAAQAEAEAASEYQAGKQKANQRRSEGGGDRK
jgi:hypothetical protein